MFKQLRSISAKALDICIEKQRNMYIVVCQMVVRWIPGQRGRGPSLGVTWAWGSHRGGPSFPHPFLKTLPQIPREIVFKVTFDIGTSGIVGSLCLCCVLRLQ